MTKKNACSHRPYHKTTPWQKRWLATALLSWCVALPLFLLSNDLLAQDLLAQEEADPAVTAVNAQDLTQAATQVLTQDLTLRDAFVAAYNYNPRIKAAIENVKASQANLNSTRAARLPQVSVAASYGTLEATVNGAEQSYAGQQISNSITVSTPIATFGRQEAAEKSAASQLTSAKIDFEQKKQTLFDDVTKGYFGLLFNEQAYRLKLENKSLLEKQLTQATERFDRDALTITELRAVRTRLNNANIDLLNAGANYISQKQKLASLIGRADISGLSINSGNEFLQKLPATLDDAKALLLNNAPTLREATQAIIRAQANVENSRANILPQLSLQGGTSSSLANNDVTDQQFATINMSMILPSGTGLLEQTRVTAELKRTQYNLADVKNILLDDLQNRWQGYQNYNQIVTDRYNNLQEYEKKYQDTIRALALGQTSLSQVIDVRTRLIDQYINYANAVNGKMIYGMGLANSLGLID